MSNDKQGKGSDSVPWDQRLRSKPQWRVWIDYIKSAAVSEGVWQYMDPDLSDDEVKTLPNIEDPPTPEMVNPDVSDIAELTDEEYKRFNRYTTQWTLHRPIWKEAWKGLNRLNDKITSSVATEHHSRLVGCRTPREKLLKLKENFAPEEDTRREELRQAWREMIRYKPRSTVIDQWLDSWTNLYDECKAADVPDVVYRPKDPIRDFLRSTRTLDEFFYSTWMRQVKLETPTFLHVIEEYRRRHEELSESKKGGSSALAMYANTTLFGRKPGQSGQNPSRDEYRKRCPCGGKEHHFSECPYFVKSRRPEGWKPEGRIERNMDRFIKMMSPSDQEEIKKLRGSTETALMPSSTQLTTTSPTQAKAVQFAAADEEDFPHINMAMLSVNISPYVYHAASLYPLKNAWIVDSGANVHICNRRDRFDFLENDHFKISTGDGESSIEGVGSARLTVRNPWNGKQSVTKISNVLYAPDFHTNILSVSEIKKNGYFFNSEIPAITYRRKAIAHCAELYGLYLLEYSKASALAFPSLKPSAKPLVSTATPARWHRRLGHMYDQRVERLAEMVDGIDIKGRTEENAESNPEKCEPCQLARARKQISRRPAGRTHIYGKFGKVHFDLIEMDEAFNGDRWVSHLYVEGIRLHLAASHRKKNGCQQAIKYFVAYLINHLKMPLRAFHTDNERSAGETVWDYCRSMGFVVEFIVVDTPEQNSFAERAGG
ncbi:uncharacterized protein N7473_004487 [Penicillium subrubescens]|nr:uncharacterized protein N7473_004487 [Penicillium subrubescens]KAJ5900417.1 hypothetical protein N7473_004487 [Penicillium subrubescens]